MSNNDVMLQRSTAQTMSRIRLGGIFLETNKHQVLMRFWGLIRRDKKPHPKQRMGVPPERDGLVSQGTLKAGSAETLLLRSK